MKIQYKIPTQYGEVTRTSVREYTHVVVAGKVTEQVTRKNHAWIIERYTSEIKLARAAIADNFADTVAREIRLIEWSTPFDANNPEHAERIASRVEKTKASMLAMIEKYEAFLKNEKEILEQSLKNRKPLGLIGFAGNERLAAKLANGWQAKECEDVVIVEIKPEYRKEIVSRKRK